MNKQLILSGIILICFGLVCSKIYSQDAKSIKNLYYKAEDAFYYENYDDAIAYYQELENKDPLDKNYFHFQIGRCYLYSNTNHEKALEYIASAKQELSRSPIADIYFYNLALAYHMGNQFDEAKNAYAYVLAMKLGKNARSEVNRQIEMCDNGKLLTGNPLEVSISNMGERVNTTFPEYKPVIAADDATILFTSRREGNNGRKIKREGGYYEDIYLSERDRYGNWGEPNRLDGNINTDSHEATATMSVDGHEFFLYKGDIRGGELYLSTLEEDTTWSDPQTLGKNVNTRFWETSAGLSSDGSTIYFTSNRRGGYGGRDIYKSVRLPDGSWGKAENLGPTINTGYDEESPHILPDGSTLYFSSSGHKSMGGFDIFKTTLENGSWTTPENIGYPINTPADEAHYMLSADENKAYYTSSMPGGAGEEDLYEVIVSDIPLEYTLVRGSFTGEMVNPTIAVIDRETKQEIDHVFQPSHSTADYLLLVPHGRQYDMVVSAEGIQPQLVPVDIPTQTGFYEVYQKIDVEQSGGEQRVQVINSFFDPQLPFNNDNTFPKTGHQINRQYLKFLAAQINEATNALPTDNYDEAKQNSEPLKTYVTRAIQMTGDLANISPDYLLDNELYTNLFTKRYSKEGGEPAGLMAYATKNQTYYVIPSNGAVPSVITDAEDKPIEAVSELSEKLEATILFSFNSTDLRASYVDILAPMVAALVKDTELKVSIEGHADTNGSAEYNMKLSQKRANTIANYLARNGVKRSQLHLAALGESKPLVAGDSIEALEKNRRAVVTIMQ